MLINFAVVTIIALLLMQLFEKLKLPGLLGLIAAGVLLGKWARTAFQSVLPTSFYDFYQAHLSLSDKILDISTELRTAALIVILLRAGLGISKHTLNRVGGPALRMSFIPGLLEGAAITGFACFFFNLPFREAGIIGFVIAAVSPAVVVPQMLGLKDSGHGEDKEIPTLILAASSVDDVFAITVFGVFLDMCRIGNESHSALSGILSIPVGIVTGIAAGLPTGLLLVKLFKRFSIRDTRKAILIMIASIMLFAIQEMHLFPFAGLLGVMAIGFVILEKYEVLAKRMANKFNKIWVFAEIVLFVLIGAEVNIGAAFKAGSAGVLLIFLGLLFRSAGVWLSLLGSELNGKEKLFCVIAYIPKATVQAAIGGIALSLAKTNSISLSGGVETGEFILALAVMSILLTAPIGAVGISLSAPKLLKNRRDSKAMADAV